MAWSSYFCKVAHYRYTVLRFTDRKECKMKISIRLLVLMSLLAAVSPSPAGATSSNLVISQLYLGTGQSESKLRNQYIELFNGGTAAVNLSGITLQYSQEGFNMWQQVFPLSGSIGPGQYYLIYAGATGGNILLPPADRIITFTLPLSAGKIALVSDIVALGTPCSLDT